MYNTDVAHAAFSRLWKLLFSRELPDRCSHGCITPGPELMVKSTLRSAWNRFDEGRDLKPSIDMMSLKASNIVSALTLPVGHAEGLKRLLASGEIREHPFY